MSRALSDRANREGPSGCLILFGLVFAGFGSIFVFVFFLGPLLTFVKAGNWVEVPCTVLESWVGENRSGDGGPTYRVEVRFEYRVRDGGSQFAEDARRYESTRYDFSGGIYSSGRGAKEAEVRRLAPGTNTTCHVDPAHPTEAVLMAGLPAGLLLGALVLIFPLVGVALVIRGVVGIRRARLRRAGRLPLSGSAVATQSLAGDSGETHGATGPLELRPAQTRVGKAVATGIFAAFWNGVTWTILVLAVLPGFSEGGDRPWFLLLFLSVFVMVGLRSIGVFVHQLLALRNPRLHLTVNDGIMRPGDWREFGWRCLGNPSRITSLTLTLEGRESATYTRGTDTVTDTHVFARLTLATLHGAAAIQSGQTRFQIPAQAMPTFIAKHNRFEWRLLVRGAIPRWPDINDDYAVTVLPPRPVP